MSFRLPSYRPADCCPGLHCYHGNEAEPCWGQTEVVDEINWGDDWGWVHACEGHARWEGPYTPSDRPEDQGATPIDDEE